MNQQQWKRAVAAMVVVLGVAVVAANEKAPASFAEAMKGINATNIKLRGHVTAKDFDGLAADAAALKPFAETTLKFWQEKKVEDAVKAATDLNKAVADLAAAAKAKDEAALGAASQAMGATCRTCHTAHRSERLPDGTYEIK